MNPIINLDVGGVKYKTSKNTLVKHDGVLKDLVENTVENQEVFIDRDGTLFSYILDYLRNGNKAVLPDNLNTCQRLLVECEYYCLPELLERLKELTYKFRVRAKIDYHILASTNLATLQEEVVNSIKNGWIPDGTIVVNSRANGSLYIQKMM
jgi:hypothetical protein